MNQLYHYIRMKIVIERHGWLFEHTKLRIKILVFDFREDLLFVRYWNGRWFQ